MNLHFGSQNYLEYFSIVTNNELMDFFFIGEVRGHVSCTYLKFGTIFIEYMGHLQKLCST